MTVESSVSYDVDKEISSRTFSKGIEVEKGCGTRWSSVLWLYIWPVCLWLQIKVLFYLDKYTLPNFIYLKIFWRWLFRTRVSNLLRKFMIQSHHLDYFFLNKLNDGFLRFMGLLWATRNFLLGMGDYRNIPGQRRYRESLVRYMEGNRSIYKFISVFILKSIQSIYTYICHLFENYRFRFTFVGWRRWLWVLWITEVLTFSFHLMMVLAIKNHRIHTNLPLYAGMT